MRLPTIAFLLIAVSAAAAPPYGYEWMNEEPSAQLVQQAGTLTASRAAQAWRLSVGYAVRSFEADFQMSAPSIGLIAPYLGGLGDVGFYGGGSELLEYEDGYLGPWSILGSGAVFGGLYDHSDLVIVFGPGVDLKSTTVFHSTGYSLPRDHASTTERSSGWGPYVRVSNMLAEDAFGSLGLSVTWTSLHAGLESNAVFGHPEPKFLRLRL